MLVGVLCVNLIVLTPNNISLNLPRDDGMKSTIQTEFLSQTNELNVRKMKDLTKHYMFYFLCS